MGKGINKVILIGNLGQDPEIRYTASGAAVANLSLATSETWKDKQTGDQKENTEWHKVVLFGKTAEIASQYLKKGRQVYIEGRLQTRRWQDKSGADRYSTEIVGNDMQMIGGGDGHRQQSHQAAPPAQQPTQPDGGAGGGNFEGGDIPFAPVTWWAA